MDSFSMQAQSNKILLLNISRVSTQTLIKCSLLSLINVALLFSKTNK
jgi:hypothetical protein